MKRILCIVSAMNTGGAETFLMKLYRQLDKTKFQMDFCVNETKKGFYEDEILKLGGRIYRIPMKTENMRAFKNALFQTVRDNKYKYVMRVTSNAVGFLDLKIAKKAGAEMCIARSSNSSDGGSRKAEMANKMGRVLYGRYVDVKIAPSDLAAKYTFGESAFRRGEVHFLHNALDLNCYCFDQSEREAVRREFHIQPDTKVVGHIGRFNRQKNHAFLLKIFCVIHGMEPNSMLLLVGRGEMEKEIREQVRSLGLEDAVIFAGIRSDIPALFSAMDVFVFPSFFEGMPNTVIEAQAVGVPCIISDTITREAGITGIVHYESLSDTEEKWADAALSAVKMGHINTRDKMRVGGYDIQEEVRQFTKLVFQEV